MRAPHPGMRPVGRRRPWTRSAALAGRFLAQRPAEDDVRTMRQAFVEHVLSWIEPLAITAPVARAQAEIWAVLERRGRAIGAHDMWIAATAICHGMDLATHNAGEFERVPGLGVIAL